jgi:predicted nucleic acid-binding protein
MGSLSSLTDAQGLLVADASTIISVNATGCANRIIKALPNRVAVVDIVSGELEEGKQRKPRRQDADLLKKLVDAGHVEIVRLDAKGEEYFEQLVVGAAQMTLDDGEAATIAYAVANNGIALIDEKKANRICAQRFPELRLACTVDIFMHPNVQSALGKEVLVDTVFNALCHGRMRVFPHHVEWVIELIGVERVRMCTSLPGQVRGSRQAATGQAAGAGSKRILR